MKSKIRRILVPLFACAATLFGTSCHSQYGSVHTKRSAVVGGAVGAIGGALIGEHNDRELEGAAIGGVAGAIAGGLLGSARDEVYHRQRSTSTQQTYRTYSPAPPYQSYGNSYRGSRSGYRHYPSQHHHYYRPSYPSHSYCR